MARRPTCFLACPYGEKGGGMGRIMDYLLRGTADRALPLRFEALETRGAGRRLHSAPALAVAAARIALRTLRRRPCFVHVNVAERGSVLRKGVLIAVARLCGARPVVHLHAAQIVAFYRALPAAGRVLVRAMFRAARLCIVLGEASRAFVAEELGVAPERIAILRNGVPETGLARVPGDGTFRILFLGNLLARKGVDDLLRALAHPALAGEDWQATIAGGGAVASYQARTAAFDLADRIRFTGWLDQDAAAARIARADALVLPSYDEGLPLVVLEALSLGVPVVTTPVGAIPEVLAHEQTALLVPPGDTEALARTLLRLMRDPALRARLSTEGAALYQRAFTLDAFIARLLDLYRTRCGLGDAA